MNLGVFFEKFDQFADAPDAVAKMRGLILRLAMQGKLSEPHESDGPVSQLLREVEKDRVGLGLESSAKSASGNSELPDDEKADVVPARWTWVRFGSIARHNAGKTLDKGRNRGKLRDYITTSNLYWGYFQLDAVRQMPILNDELERCTAIKGDLLICEGGEAGRAAVWPHDREISFQNHVHRARFFAGINPHFVQRYFEKLNATGEIEKYRKGVGISNMSGKALASIPIPLPPLAEQKRIVAKVDELMALCDRLEVQQQERQTRHAALSRASLARFADAPTPANLQFLFHPSYAISPADLRKSILTLAVQGKLVPQDPNDGPAEKALARLEACGGNAKIRRSVPTEVNRPDSLDAGNLPESWCMESTARLLQLGAICDLKDGNHGANHPKVAEFTAIGLPFITAAQVSNDGQIDYDGAYKVSGEALKRLRVGFAKPNDVIYTHKGSVGRVAICDRECVLTPQTTYYRVNEEVLCSGFARINLLSPLFQDQVDLVKRQTTRDFVSINAQYQFFLRIPPLAEQRRIVAKVDQLMALVNELQTQLATSHTTGAGLMEAVVAELTAKA